MQMLGVTLSKEKGGDELLITDCSSDECSSDLLGSFWVESGPWDHCPTRFMATRARRSLQIFPTSWTTFRPPFRALRCMLAIVIPGTSIRCAATVELPYLWRQE